MKFFQLFLLSLFLASPTAGADVIPQGCEMVVSIGDRKAVEFIVRCFDKKQLVDLVAMMIADEKLEEKRQLSALLLASGELTLTITTKRSMK